MRKMAHVHPCFFEPVDFGKHVAKDLIVGSTKILATRSIGNLTQCAFVDYNLLRLVFNIAEHAHDGSRSHAVGANTYRVDAHSEFLSHVCRHYRSHNAGIVRSVGEENYAPAFCLAFFETVERSGNAIANGGAVGKDIHLDGVDIVEKHRAVDVMGMPVRLSPAKITTPILSPSRPATNFCATAFAASRRSG